ncbi:helix-turn-helix transcriptional regulator [Nigerium massiliense]|uniref:helix-turn-helix transcriptional regulator n=1 Tax=Nigerium massiliense TaxID=1522317 RepID=UPI00058C7780|nr:WYL domain-containing protein [Nigerium massiliense]
MSARKSERILNLTICLLMARRFVEREQIREAVEGYAGLSDAAFERTFERDKDELRALGVPIETGSNSAFFPDEVGYRIRRRDFELPEIDFTAAELAALGVASTVWDDARRGDQAAQALAKFRAAGLDPDAGRAAGFAPSVGAREPAFETLWSAVLAPHPVAFRYKGRDRVVEPWRLTSRHGSWYLIGLDRSRGEGRSFKVSRIEDAPRPADGTVTPPDPAVVQQHLESLAARRDARATIAVREGAVPELIRSGERVQAEVGEGFAAWSVPVSADPGEIAQWASDVVVLDPPELAAAVRAHLEAVAAWA